MTSTGSWEGDRQGPLRSAKVAARRGVVVLPHQPGAGVECLAAPDPSGHRIGRDGSLDEAENLVAVVGDAQGFWHGAEASLAAMASKPVHGGGPLTGHAVHGAT